MEKREIKNELILKIKKDIETFLSEYDFKLVDIEIRHNNKSPILTIYVYNKEDMSVNKLAFLSKKMNTTILASLNQDFMIEISSPGINRIIKNIEEFEIFKEKEIKILTDQNQYIIGICKGIVDCNRLSLLSNGKKIFIDIKNIKKAKLFG